MIPVSLSSFKILCNNIYTKNSKLRKANNLVADSKTIRLIELQNPTLDHTLMKKQLIAILLACTGSLVNGTAETRVVGLAFNPSIPGLQSYTVPAGKTLLIENVSAWYATNSPTTPRIVIEIGLIDQGFATTTMPFGFVVESKFESLSLKRPLRVPAGQWVRCANSTLAYNEIRIQGLLVDNADLYAANLDVETKAVGLQEGRFVAEATVASPRPAIVKTKTSTDLVTFEDNATEEKSRQADPKKWTVSTAADSPNKFLVATAKVREGR